MSIVMTHSLRAELAALLSPVALTSARDVFDNHSIVPELPGIYGWWFDPTLPKVSLDGTLCTQGKHLLYVGIAPRAPSSAGRESSSNLRRRLVGNHLRTRIGSSTLRRSLAALLAPMLGFEISRTPAGKQIMSKDNEEALTSWMLDHAALSTMSVASPWLIEDELISTGPSLPLNIKGSTAPFATELSAMRSA